MTTLGKYELIARLASGGMAEIWVGRPTDDPDRVCVVKRLLPEHAGSSDFIEMFVDEGRIASLLQHPNVVRTYDYGQHADTHYLAMEYLHGQDLRAVLRVLKSRETGMPAEHAVHIISAVCAGLHHAHEAKGRDGKPLGIVHRDVSPHNVFVTFDGGVKVFDFGIAKSEGRSFETKHGTLKGKVPYMAPEQVKGHVVDRRADIYAIGVMLYELLLLRRPYPTDTRGEFATMMAIVGGDIASPTSVDPSISPHLERIILRALAYDDRGRYRTAAEMQAELDEFARASRLQSSPRSLSLFVASLFPDIFEQWQRARGSDLIQHAVNVEQQRALQADDEPESVEIDKDARTVTRGSQPSLARAAPHAAAALVASKSAAVASIAELLSVTVVSLQGRIDERFDGAELGRVLSGTVLFDLKAVERVTSYGVREWLEMVRLLDAAENTRVWLARCSEAVVAQLTMIKAFGGRAHLASFDAPFLCDDCGTAFARTIDCERDRDLIEGRRPAVAHCPQCGGTSKLDDDPSYLSFAAAPSAVAVPANVRTLLLALEERDRGPQDVVDKLVAGDETRVRVHRDVRAYRWKRALDGIEGKVVIDFRGLPRFGADSAESFTRALRALSNDVERCEIVEAPATVARALGQLPDGGRLSVTSVAFEGRCGSCAAQRPASVSRQELEVVWRTGAPPTVPCRRCGAELVLAGAESVVHAMFGAPAAAAAELSSVSTVAAATDVSPAAAKAHARRTPVVLVAAAVAMILLIGIALSTRRGAQPTTVAANASGQTSASVAVPSVPPSVEIHGDAIDFNVTSRGADDDHALAGARAAAISALVTEIERALPEPVRVANARVDTVASAETVVAERYTGDVGSIASPERVDVHARNEGSATVIAARYRISRAALARAVAFYGATARVGGFTFAPVLPSRGRGVVVVASDSVSSVPVGALLERVGGTERPKLDAVARLPKQRHAATFSTRGNLVAAHLDVR